MCLISALAGIRPTAAQDSAAPIDVFMSQVRETDPLTPNQERLKLNVPAGFEVSLFASEPQLQKPLNMAFDADGKLWVTGSNEYPYPSKDGPGSDSIRVLRDTNGDGEADEVTVFADDLNIPMGIYPYRDGAIVFSLPNILFLRDTNGDGKADKREVLYGPFDTSRDTHGMNNSFRRGFDGWLYCCHGFNNQSTVSGSDGHEVSMQSGNTYRIRLDGSRIEHFGHGQVNPFGMTIDANGDIFNSDCHTKPVSLILRDGYYESFGKPHDGLGFVPAVMEHLHGSTAIDGLCQYQGTAFPQEYHDDIFVGNVMTCRVHRNSIIRAESGISMQEEDDFLTSDDPWFRPVDIQIGPDGAMYVADFYNRVIGHYEVPLDHPGRDRRRGRIWKITYTDGAKSASSVQPLTKAMLPDLIVSLDANQKPIRQQAADQIVDRIGADAVPALMAGVSSAIATADQNAVPQLLWCLQRLGGLKTETLTNCYLKGADRTRIHVVRICSEVENTEDVTLLIRSGLRDPAALVRRAAADAAGRHPRVELFKEVVNAMVTLQGKDVHLAHALRIALRNQLLHKDVAEWFTSQDQPRASANAVAGILPGLNCDHSADVALGMLQKNSVLSSSQRLLFRHAAENISQDSISKLTTLTKNLPASDSAFQMEIWATMSDGIRSRELTPPDDFISWSTRLGENVFKSYDLLDIHWGSYQWDDRPAVRWDFEKRRFSATSTKQLPFISSLPGGESGVGVLRSRPFVIPFTLELELCGHRGRPADPAVPENRVVLRDYKTGAELLTVFPPRSDIAQKVSLDVNPFLGTRAYLEVIDGIDQPSFAWLAIGRLSPSILKSSGFDSGNSTSMLASALKFLRSRQQTGQRLSSTETARVFDILTAIQVDGHVRALAATVLLHHQKKSFLQGVADVLPIASTPRAIDTAIVAYCKPSPGQAVASTDTAISDEAGRKKDLEFLRQIFSTVDRTLRRKLTAGLAENRAGADLLLACIESGTPSAQVLRDDRLAQQLSAYGDGFESRVAAQTTQLPHESADTDALTTSVVRRLRLAEGNAKAGQAVFTKHCAVCHRRGGEGKLVGPQLDGIQSRGQVRLLEDILQPNQNVDVAFRTTLLALKDGRVLSGMIRPTNDPQVLDVVDVQGKTKTVAKREIENRKDSAVSLMPSDVMKILSEEELLNLVHWLSKSPSHRHD